MIVFIKVISLLWYQIAVSYSCTNVLGLELSQSVRVKAGQEVDNQPVKFRDVFKKGLRV